MNSFAISVFKSKTDNKPQTVRRTWTELTERFQKPAVRKEKDGALFSPAIFSPALRRKENVQAVSMLVLDIDHNADFETIKTNLTALQSAYAIYSTHSHLRRTEKNPSAEPRYRVCLPLESEIPAKDFSALWQYAKQETNLPLDENAKDSSRMFYTPVKADENAPYQVYISDGKFLDWQSLPLDSYRNGTKANKKTVKTDKQTLAFEYHEQRHTELCQRIETQAKATGRDTFEMKCPAHNGKGESSLFYDPATQTVACIKKPNPCGYFEILHAFGLSNGHLPSREKAKKEKEAENKPLQIIKASEVVPKEIEWLWHPYIPKNYVTLFSGEEGVGKSWVFCAIASGITNGFLHFADKFEPQNVLIFSAEDAADDALVPRLIKCEADLTRVFIVNERFTFDEKGLQRFEHYIAETNPVWVIIDPLFAYSDLKLDLNKQHHARFVASGIERIAKKFSIAISYLIHFNKSKGGGDARAAVSSSQEFSNAARSILLIGKDPNDETRRALIHRKHNYSPKGKAIGYQILGDKSDVNFAWLGESTLTENEIVGTRGNETERGEQSEAVSFLENALADGRRKASDVIKEAETLGISQHKLRTARAKLGIQPHSVGFTDKVWFWELPKKPSAEDVRQNEKPHLRVNQSDKSNHNNNLPVDVGDSKKSHLRGEDAGDFHHQKNDKTNDNNNLPVDASEDVENTEDVVYPHLRVNNTKQTTYTDENIEDVISQSVIASTPDSHLSEHTFNAFNANTGKESCPTCDKELVPYQDNQVMCEICLYTKTL
ncbi:MAG: AAA family ATPase [Acidobacteriota bacterium]|jgi:hypothetical protein|nr:AAA family ATPase [Acidobacteriota bacterium]